MNSINRDILRLSIPAIVSNITVPLLGLCDTAVAGHLGSGLFLAAIAVGSVMLNVVFWMFGFLRMGTTGLTATALGKNNDPGIRKAFTRAVGLAVMAGILLIIFQNPLFFILEKLVGFDYEIKTQVADYFFIRIWGAPALLTITAISGWFVGMQTTFYPMAIAITVNIINIGATLFCVYGIGMGFNGIATGTLISNWAGAGLALFLCYRFRKGKSLWCSTYEALHGGGIWRFFSVNSNLFLRSAFIIAVTMGVTAAGARLGVEVLAVNVVVMQFFQLFSFFMDGFAFSGEALVGLRFGRGDIKLLNKSVNTLLLWTLGTATIFTIIYFSGCNIITSLLTDDMEVRRGVAEMLLWISLIPIVSAWAFIFDGFYVGLTMTSRMMWATFIASVAFFAVVFILPGQNGNYVSISGNDIIWSAFLAYLFLRGAVLALLWKNTIRRSLIIKNGMSLL